MKRRLADFKKSGFGREKGVEAMANYQQVRNIGVKLL